MDGRRLRAGAVLLLAVAALGAAGAAVEQQGGGGGSVGSGSGSGSGSGGGEGIGFEQVEQTSDPLFSSEPLVMLIGALAIAGIVVGIVYVALLVVELDLEELYAVARSLAGRVAIGIALLVVAYFVLQFLAFPGGGGGTDGALGGESGGVADTAADGGVDMPAVIGAAVLALVVLALLVLVRSGEEDEEGVAQVAPDTDEAAVGTTGGSPASTDVGRPPADNEVYRAWLSLADAADADPRRATPETVADGAVGTGVDEDAAREITSLFESVRYGRRDVDDGVERRARRARERLRGDS